MTAKTIACLFPLTSHYAMTVAEGVAGYVARHPHLRLQIPGRFGYMPLASAKEFHGDGVIGFFESVQEIQTFRKRGITVVNASGLTDQVHPWVHANDQRIGALAAEGFCLHGFRDFLYVDFIDMKKPGNADEALFSHLRFIGFQKQLQASGFGCDRLRLKRQPFYQISGWRQGLQRLARNLGRQSKPVGVFCVNDHAASLVATACQQAGLKIPEEIGIIGTDNDSMVCHGVEPSLSSVDLGAVRIGWEAARILDEMMAGKTMENLEVCLDPLELVERGSLTNIGDHDPQIANALRMMRQNLTDPRLIATLPKELGMSRRSFERRFKQAVSRSPAQELIKLRLHKVQQELLKSPRPIKEIARDCGFGGAEHLQKVFRQHFGQPPDAWRQQNRMH